LGAPKGNALDEVDFGLNSNRLLVPKPPDKVFGTGRPPNKLPPDGPCVELLGLESEEVTNKPFDVLPDFAVGGLEA
jgi:hypothetical protein